MSLALIAVECSLLSLGLDISLVVASGFNLRMQY
jgi:hypothetical protein